MKKLILPLLGVLVLGLSACGTKTHVASNPQAQALTSQADKTVAKCLPNPLTLSSHAGRQKFVACAVPPAHKQEFAACIEKVALSGIPTKARLEQGASACLQKVA